ncbi:hypothetical protein [Micromonospora sp. URMC 103]|uniref:hypothetical protein n=1 Tax=Micromonospora sp. URMC 103 TaxID=3423406 RepID=UPI003F1B22FB
MLGVALTGYGFIDGATAGSDYEVHFADAGDKCYGTEVFIDADTGERLTCFGATDERNSSPFTRSERDHVFAVAERLGADGDGLSDADRQQVEELVDSIGAANGDPDEAADRTWWSPGSLAYLLGLPMMLIGGMAVLVAWSDRPPR